MTRLPKEEMAELLRRMAATGDRTLVHTVACRLDAPPDVLADLAVRYRGDIAYAVAVNPRTPQATLRMLARRRDWSIRSAVGRNPSTPKDTLLRLTRSVVRQERERRPHEPPSLVGPRDQVFLSLSSNKRLPPEAQRLLMGHRDAWVRGNWS